MNMKPHHYLAVLASCGTLVGCPIEPVPSSSYCGELCIASASEGTDQGFGEPDEGVLFRPDMGQGGARVTCQIGLGEDGLEFERVSGDVQLSVTGNTLSVTGNVGEHFELALVGSSMRQVSMWIQGLTLDASCSEFTSGELDLYAWGAGGVALMSAPANLSTLSDARTEIHRSRGVMAAFVESVGLWQLLRTSSIEASGVQVLTLDSSVPGSDTSILLDGTFEVEISPSGKTAVFYNQRNVVLVNGLDAQPRVTATHTLNQALEGVRWQSDEVMLGRDGFTLYRFEPVLGSVNIVGGVASEIVDYDVYADGIIARLTRGRLGRFSVGGERESLDSAPSEMLEPYVSVDGASLLFTEGQMCKRDPFVGLCTVTLVDAQTLDVLTNTDGEQTRFDEVLAITKHDGGFVLLGQEQERLSLIRLSVTSGQPVHIERIDVPELFLVSELDAQNSLVLEQGFVLSGPDLIVVDAAQNTTRQREGAWRLWHESKASRSAEFIRQSVNWQESERLLLDTRHGQEQLAGQSGVHLGRDLDLVVSKRLQSLNELLIGPSDLAPSVIARTPEINLLPTPSGAPCVLYVHDVLSQGRQKSDLSMASCATFNNP